MNPKTAPTATAAPIAASRRTAAPMYGPVGSEAVVSEHGHGSVVVVYETGVVDAPTVIFPHVVPFAKGYGGAAVVSITAPDV